VDNSDAVIDLELDLLEVNRRIDKIISEDKEIEHSIVELFERFKERIEGLEARVKDFEVLNNG